MPRVNSEALRYGILRRRLILELLYFVSCHRRDAIVWWDHNPGYRKICAVFHIWMSCRVRLVLERPSKVFPLCHHIYFYWWNCSIFQLDFIRQENKSGSMVRMSGGYMNNCRNDASQRVNKLQKPVKEEEQFVHTWRKGPTLTLISKAKSQVGAL